MKLGKTGGGLEYLKGYDPEKEDQNYFASYDEARSYAERIAQFPYNEIRDIRLQGSQVVPDEVSCPVILPKGTKIYVVREQDIGMNHSPITIATVEFMRIEGGAGRTHYTLAPEYTLMNHKHGGGWELLTFSYYEDTDLSVKVGPLFETGKTPERVLAFSTEQGAQDCVRQFAQEKIEKLLGQYPPPMP